MNLRVIRNYYNENTTDDIGVIRRRESRRTHLFRRIWLSTALLMSGYIKRILFQSSSWYFQPLTSSSCCAKHENIHKGQYQSKSQNSRWSTSSNTTYATSKETPSPMGQWKGHTPQAGCYPVHLSRIPCSRTRTWSKIMQIPWKNLTVPLAIP